MKGIALGRKLFHFSGIIVPLACLAFGRAFAIGLCAVLLGICIVLEALRIKGYIALHVAKDLLKDHEKKRPTGSFFFLLSSLVTLLVFGERHAVPALFVLSISDPLSSYVGYYFGKPPFFGKSLPGLLAFFFSTLVILIFFSFPAHAVAITAAAAALTEHFSSRYFDDNLSIPIVTALCLSLLA